jgi:hypothetical protein
MIMLLPSSCSIAGSMPRDKHRRRIRSVHANALATNNLSWASTASQMGICIHVFSSICSIRLRHDRPPSRRPLLSCPDLQDVFSANVS